MISDPRAVLARPLATFAIALALAAAGAGQERVALTPKDGHPIVGTLMKPTGAIKGGVVALPAAKSARVAFDPLLPRLAQAGLLAIAIDPRTDSGPPVESAPSRPVDSSGTKLDLDAALELLVERGAPIDKLAIVSSGSGTSLALAYAARTGRRVKSLVLLSPGRDEPVPPKEFLAEVSPRPILVVATEEEAPKGAHAIKEALGAELNLLPDRLASGTTMFGRVTGIESTIAEWLDRMLAQPSALDIPESKLVFMDGEVNPDEAAGALVLQVPLGAGAPATVRVTQARKRLIFGFDVPEPYVRLNEIVIYVDSSGQGGRVIDKNCWRISFNPKNPARKPMLVQRGGLKGFEDTDEKGVSYYARTEEKRRWTAEVSLEFSRFLPPEPPKSIRLGFQVNGQRVSDVRYFPDDAKLPTAPGSWAVANLK
jgi:pimeloyl-ACP methyl ester carboxylesterase